MKHNERSAFFDDAQRGERGTSLTGHPSGRKSHTPGPTPPSSSVKCSTVSGRQA